MHNNPVDSPEHYQFGQLEAWDIIELAVMDIADPVTAYHAASALKYLLRASRKGGDTDIAKASAHLKRETARHVVRIPPPPEYDPDSVAFRHGDPDRVCGMTDAPTLTKYIYKHFPDGSATLYPEPTAEHDSTHPMAAEALRDRDDTTPGCAPWRLP